MKKLLITALLGSVAAVIPVSAEAKSGPASVETTQIRVQIGRNSRRYSRRVRTRTYTRIVGFGRNRFRETVRVTYLPNGRTISRVIRRQRIGWYRG